MDALWLFCGYWELKSVLPVFGGCFFVPPISFSHRHFFFSAESLFPCLGSLRTIPMPVNNSRLEPELNNSRLEPGLNNSRLEPRLNNSRLEPRLNNSRTWAKQLTQVLFHWPRPLHCLLSCLQSPANHCHPQNTTAVTQPPTVWPAEQTLKPDLSGWVLRLMCGSYALWFWHPHQTVSGICPDDHNDSCLGSDSDEGSFETAKSMGSLLLPWHCQCCQIWTTYI